MRKRLEKVKNLGRKIGLNDEKGYAVAIFLALIIVSSLAIGYYVLFRPQPSGYNSIYLLDYQKKIIDYPMVLVVNQNSTFNVYVNVDNHLGYKENYQILTKITNDLSSLPVNVPATNSTEITLNDGQSWQGLFTVTQNQAGSYSVVFELWQYNQGSGAYEFTNNYCVLNFQVIS
ncbi:MAG: DUF1616 domain-containing protein [Candidatus Bathyarchaeia archaeon]|jgi:uncharacterized membrane protein